MKRAVLYTRVSTDDQADRGYSLRDQEARLRQHCEREGYEVLAHFQDDASAKTFNRPAWKQLLARLDVGGVDAVLVVKWDRFSRDATGALGMIRTLEAIGVAVQAIDQPIDRTVPEQLMMLAIYVAAPEVENRRRSLNVKQGMRRAMREGRYVNVPPKGYRRGYDEAMKYVIEPADDAGYVEEAFRLAAETALSIRVIARRLRARGWKCSKSQMQRLLQNPIYCGKIFIPAWRGEPAETVKGLHAPIVSEYLFERVQRARFQPKQTRYRKLVDELPLRGHLLCPDTGTRLLGSGSTSRHGYRVWYYHGRGKGAFRLRADEAHETFEEYLSGVQLADDVAALYREMARETRSAAKQTRARQMRQAREEAERLEARLLLVDERFLDGDLEADSYQRLKAKYGEELQAARYRLVELGGRGDGFGEQMSFAANVLSRLSSVWHGASTEMRDQLLGSIWPAGLVIAGGDCRTPEPSELIALFGGESHKSRNTDPSKGASVSCGGPGGTVVEPGGAHVLAQFYELRGLLAA